MSARSSPSLQLHSVYTERNIQRQDSSVFFLWLHLPISWKYSCVLLGSYIHISWKYSQTYLVSLDADESSESALDVHIFYFFYSFVQTQTMMSLLTADQIGHVMCFWLKIRIVSWFFYFLFLFFQTRVRKFSIFITSLQHFSLFQLTYVPNNAHLTWGIWFVMRSYCHDVLSGGAYNQPLLETSTGAGDSALYKIPPGIWHIEGISAAWSCRISWRCRR